MAVAAVDPDGGGFTGRHYQKLTAKVVKIARRRANDGEALPLIAKHLKVNYSALAVAVSGKTWSHLNERSAYVE